MDSVRSDGAPGAGRNGGAGAPPIPVTLKILVAGGSGVGKTTMVAAVSEIQPLQAEEEITGACGADPGVATVTMDFGRISLTDDLQLYLFGAPRQDRLRSLFDELVRGALGAVVVADPRRPGDCRPAIDHVRRRGTPFVVAVNCFDGVPDIGVAALRQALVLEPAVPVLLFDARERHQSRNVLIALVQHAAQRQVATAGA